MKINMVTFIRCKVFVLSWIILAYFISADARTVNLTDFEYEDRARARKNYTIAIFEDNKWPSYTGAILQSTPVLNFSKPSDYKPLLKPGQFTVVGEVDDTHEGEVFLSNEDSQNTIDVRPDQINNTYYHTISDDDFNYSLEHPIPESSVHSYFPVEGSESTVYPSDINFTGYLDNSNFSGYPESQHPVSSISITEPSWHLSPVPGGEILLHDASNGSSNPTTVKLKPGISHTKFYVGHKLWYSAVLFAVFQIIITKILLINHSDNSSIGEAISKSFRAVQNVVLDLNNWVKILFSDNENSNYKLSLRGTERGIITHVIWMSPLYFNVYFILYMVYLTIKSVAGHKIRLPTIKRLTYRPSKNVDSVLSKSEDWLKLKKVINHLCRPLMEMVEQSISSTETGRTSQSMLAMKVYYAPLYFSVYFTIYIGYLILKAIARHKIRIPEDTSNSYLLFAKIASLPNSVSFDREHFLGFHRPQYVTPVDRFIPHAKRPNELGVAIEQPQETVFVEQVEFPTNSPHNEHVGYYNNPNYVTQHPIYFTTVSPVESNDAGPYTFYNLGDKIWRIPLFFAFAFITYFGYLVIRHSLFRKVEFARHNEKDVDFLAVSQLILSAIQEIYVSNN